MFLRSLWAILGLLLTFSPLSADELPPRPPPFEKIYVSPQEILSTPQGIFYISPEGEYRPVRTIRRDKDGRTFVILITQECPICGRWCTGKSCPEGYDCPFFELEVRPHCWTDH